MDDSKRCQSCGMPLGPGFFGTEKDGSSTREYCTMCFAAGKFTETTMSLKEMLARSVEHMEQEMGYSLEKATKLAEEVVPQLKRWQAKKKK